MYYSLLFNDVFTLPVTIHYNLITASTFIYRENRFFPIRLHSFFISTLQIKHIKAFFQKNKHIKNFDDQIWKFLHMSKHIKGHVMSKIKHMRKNHRISEINLMKMLLKLLVYMISIFTLLAKIPSDYFFQLFYLLSVIFVI